METERLSFLELRSMFYLEAGVCYDKFDRNDPEVVSRLRNRLGDNFYSALCDGSKPIGEIPKENSSSKSYYG